MNKKTVVLLVAAAGVSAALAWYFTHPGAAPATPAPAAGAGAGKGAGGGQPPTVVNVVAPQRQDVPVVLSANGTVTPLSTVDLHPQTTSTIRKVHIQEGQFVKAGQLMFTLDDRAGRAEVDKAQAQIARDRAALADLERQYQRSVELLAQKFIAQSAADTLRSQVESARALVQASQAALQSSQVDASYNTIRAPMSGRVGAIGVYPGSLVQLSTSLATITQLDPITVAFTLPESALADVLAAQQSGSVGVEASSGASAEPVLGQLSFIDNSVDPQAGSIRLKARFDNRAGALWPGQYVTTRVTVRTIKDAVVIPQAAIITNTRGTFVYVIGPDQSALSVPVRRLHAFGLNAAVSGLTGGEKVITEGKQNLRPGGKVRLAAAPGAGKRDAPGGVTKVAAQ